MQDTHVSTQKHFGLKQLRQGVRTGRWELCERMPALQIEVS